MKVLFVYNPFSGKTQIKNRLYDILNVFANAKYELTVVPTTRRDEASEYVKNKGHLFDLVICSGGDGTLNEVVNGLLNNPNEIPPLGYIPSGSTNDFAHSLKIPRDMAKAAELIPYGNYKDVDMGKYNDKYFVYVAAFGAFTSVSYATPQDIKNIIGHAAYVIEGIKSLSSIKAYAVEVDCQQLHTKENFIYGMVTNTYYVGGLYKMDKKSVKLDDGLFEVLLIKEPKDILDLNDITSYLLKNTDESDLIYSFKTNHITFKTKEAIPWTLDGEYGDSPTDVTIDNMHKAIRMICK